MRVFLVGTSLKSRYGGPAFSVPRLAVALTEIGVEVGIWASDQSVDTSPLLFANSSVRRLRGSEAQAIEQFGKPDILHDNGIWLPHNHRFAVLATKRHIRRIVSTRGMLEPWALNHKPWKKRLAWLLYQRADLKRAHSLHATSELESQSLQRFGLGVSISVIPNGVEVPEIATLGSEERFQRERVALYMGRIHPKKGLPMLIEAWARLRPPGWLLRVVGPDESGQRAQLERSVHVAGLENVVSFAGPVEGKAKSAAFLNANILVLPTHSENFGIVVAEALAHGVPVLTTKGAPWSMIKERNCGWWVDATVDGVLGGLRAATSHDSERLRMMGANGRDWVRDEFEWKHIAKRFRAQYQKVLEEKETESEAW